MAGRGAISTARRSRRDSKGSSVMSESSTRTALVIGAGGGIGGEAAAALIRHGWRIRALTRRSQPPRAGIEWIAGDAMNAADVLKAAQGARLIVHAANPPGYKDWDRLVLPMLDNAIAAAKAVGARIILPGTVYNYGFDAFPDISEDAPQHPVSRKGAIRVEMERRLQAAASSGAPALILRAGDFYGPRSGNNWFAQGIVRPGSPVKSIFYPAPRGLGHTWAYLPGVGETMALLMERESELGTFARFNFAGNHLTGEETAQAIAQATGRANVRVWPFPWFIVGALSPFVQLFRELAEMRYLWKTEIALDGARLRALLGDAMPATPLMEAIGASLAGLGCLLARDAKRAAARAMA
jgi:nucleoside-diphosphate-sugar epimerase